MTTEDNQRHDGTDPHQHHKRDERREHAADKVHQSGADQVAHAFHVGHDARHQVARAIGVVEADREPSDVRLHLAAQLGDQALRGL